MPTVSEAGGVSNCPGAVESSGDSGAATQGGVSIIPGSGGAQGGVLVSPAKAERLSTNVKTTAALNLFRFFMFYLLNLR